MTEKNEPTYRGTALSLWAKKTPYNRLAMFVDNPTMHKSQTDHLYMVGYNKALGCKVAMHYRKRNKMVGRDAEFVVRWPYGDVSAKQGVASFQSTDAVENFLRPPSRDMAWFATLSEETRTAMALALSYAVLEDRQDLTESEKTAVKTLNHHITHDSDTQSPLRYEIPQDYRRFVAAAVQRLIHRAPGRFECHLSEDEALIADLIEALDLRITRTLAI